MSHSLTSRYFFVIFVLMTHLHTSCALTDQTPVGPQDRSDLTGSLVHVKGGVYVYRDFNYWQTNSVVYIGDDGIVFIDAPWNRYIADRIIRKVSSISPNEFRALIITDYRPHRSGGIIAFSEKDVPILYHTGALSAIIRNWDNKQARYRREFDSWIDEDAKKPDALLGGKTDFLKGKVQVLYIGDGFVSGGLVIYFPDEKVVFAGSAISDPLSFYDEMNPQKYIPLMNNILKLNIDLVIPGHGSAIENINIIYELIDNAKSKK